jgi:hypothetical protein
VAEYLGVPVRNWVGLAVVSVALGLGLAVSGALPEPTECGYVLEEGQWLAAGCSSVEELEETLAGIRAERSGEREWQ